MKNNRKMRFSLKQTYRRLLSFLMVFVVCCPVFWFASLSARAEENKAQARDEQSEAADRVGQTESSLSGQNASARGVLSVTTAEQLVELARQCSLDTFSEGLTVSLDADIDLKNSGFVQIPVFQGTFLGNGHTISGFTLKSNEVNSGFFGLLRENAAVSDLTLEGQVCPKGVLDYCGGLAGKNQGLISGCCFKGTVCYESYSAEIRSEQAVGGICGANDAEGDIVNCHTEGEISGLKYTGGICGINYGTVSRCINLAKVNISVADKSASLSELTDVKSVSDLLKLFRLKKIYASEDTGGISGYSHGAILYCYNRETVGTRNNGYNVGGIAGRTDGFLYACENLGEVLGHTNVGGIVGQLSPSIRISDGKAVLKKEDIHAVFDSLDDLVASVSGDLSDISGLVDLTLSDIDGAISSADEIERALTEVIDGKIGEVNEMTGVADDVIADVNLVTEAVNDVTGGLANMSEDVLNMAESIDDAVGHAKLAGEIVADSSGSIVDSTTDAVTKISDALSTDSFKVKASVPDQTIDHLDELEEIHAFVVIMYDDGSTSVQECMVLNESNGWSASSGSLPYKDASSGEEIMYGAYFLPIAKDGTAGVVYYIGNNQSETDDTSEKSVYKMSITGISTEPAPELSQTLEDVTIELRWPQEKGLLDKHPNQLDLYLYMYTDASFFYYKTLTANKTDCLEDDRNTWSFRASLPVELADGTPIDFSETYPDLPVLMNAGYTVSGSTYDQTTHTLVINIAVKEQSSTSIGEVISKVSTVVSKMTSVKDIAFDAGKSVGTDVSRLISDSTSELSYTLGEFKTATGYLESLAVDLSNVTYRLNDMQLQEIRSMPEFSAVGPRLDEAVEGLKEHLSDLTGHLSDINEKLNDMQQSASGDFRELLRNTEDLSDTVFDLLTDVSVSLETLLESAYEEDYTLTDSMAFEMEEEGNEGCLMNCRNEGAVRADTVAGGIVGTIEISGIPAILNDLRKSGRLSVPGIKYTALVRDCEDRSLVEASQDYVGLICGKQKFGSIVNCTAGGQASSAEGSYVGGIAGLAHADITSCSVRGKFSGRYYVGGIAGSTGDAELVYKSSDLKDCSAYVESLTAEQYSGAVSGSTLGSFENNTFVEGDLQGVCGVSVSGSYSPVSKESFSASAPGLAQYEVPVYTTKQQPSGKQYDRILKVVLVISLLLAVKIFFDRISERRIARRVVRYIDRNSGEKTPEEETSGEEIIVEELDLSEETDPGQQRNV